MSSKRKTVRGFVAAAAVAGVLSAPLAIAASANAQPAPAPKPAPTCGHPGQPACPPPAPHR
ncbi:hypothetical protein [Nocardia macrotermitis]|uniref:Uncharacterized protein n=1 Tax=Nocardia macrotermitis TaxID=2585198 RepID=A0A7K0D374_9NOCA|nr:hypothetical protein [Nocardia macrotermitis]MQY20169.1 hypothetical protein [Nocardia macrotermitis]